MKIIKNLPKWSPSYYCSYFYSPCIFPFEICIEVHFWILILAKLKQNDWWCNSNHWQVNFHYRIQSLKHFILILQWQYLSWREKQKFILPYRGFSCDVISSQLCKSSYSLPLWPFPLYMEQYCEIIIKKISQYFVFSSYHNIKIQLSGRILAHTHSVEILILSIDQSQSENYINQTCTRSHGVFSINHARAVHLRIFVNKSLIGKFYNS